MLSKSIIQFFTGLCCALVLVTAFQNCGELQEFELASEVEFENFASEGPQRLQLSHSGVTHVAPEEKIADISYSPMVLDRVGIYNLFMDIFGAEAANVSSVKQIATDYSVFGGACSVYRRTKGGTEILSNCANSENQISVKPHVGVTLLRQGRLNQACLDLTKKDSKTLNYILKRIEPKKAIPEVTDKNALSLFTLFYRTKPMPKQSLIDSIKFNIGDQPTQDGWSRAVYATCVSGYWQVL